MSKFLDQVEAIKDLFESKNPLYTAGGTGELSNFTDNSIVKAGKLTPYAYLFTLVTKHVDALQRRVFEPVHRIGWNEDVIERARDCAVYFLLLAAMADNIRKQPAGFSPIKESDTD